MILPKSFVGRRRLRRRCWLLVIGYWKKPKTNNRSEATSLRGSGAVFLSIRDSRLAPKKRRPISRAKNTFRVGLGVDVHAFAPAESGRRLILGGVDIPSERGLAGHSDADVLSHAITDALLGAAGLEDIGHYFPDTDERWRDADSIELLREARRLVGDSWIVANVDSVVVCERPKIRDHRDGMRKNLANALGVGVSDVSVRGTTSERLGFTGRGEGIAAQAVCLLERSE